MFEHIETLHVIAAEQTAGEGFSIGGALLGSVGAGGLALAGTASLIGGIKEPKAKAGGDGAGGAKKGKIRRKLTSPEATGLGLATGTCWMAAGSMWTVGGQVSNAFAQTFTSGGFGTVGMGGVSLLLAAFMYFREPRPATAALTGLVTAGVWAQAGGIWGLPQALLLTGVHAIGAA
ncbi:hypothetical protein [Streptomyces sp. NPDC089919]|uniref:hypothetical protein n=1 Tax=Streptomyces sp. NPDC089919 TaxID=3155188 RepID=UPI0034487B51